jgi:hypothetical protein
MFFYLGNNCDLLNKQKENLFTDLGWKQHHDVYYKGYCLDFDIHSNIDKILSGDKPQGIYCLIKDNKLFYPEIRPFPLYSQGEVLTNLRLENFSEIEIDRYHSLTTNSCSLDTVVNNVANIIIKNLSKVELNIWCTGGIDSVMLIALAEHANLPYTIHIAKPRNNFTDIKQWEGTVEEYDSDLLQFCRNNYWAYSFLSNFNDKIITTGFYGDEYFCRSIWQIHPLANSFNKLGCDVIKPNDYVYSYMTKPGFSHFNVIDSSINLNNVMLKTLHMIGSGHVWHLDNTITFCPLMDKRIAEQVWSLDAKTLLECAPDATIQKEIIKQTMPDVLKLVDNQKNAGQGRRNFFNNIDKVKLPNCNRLVLH